jgi:hypothetical protein
MQEVPISVRRCLFLVVCVGLCASRDFNSSLIGLSHLESLYGLHIFLTYVSCRVSSFILSSCLLFHLFYFRLNLFADEVQGLDQYAIRKFGEAFDVVPRTLAENSGGGSWVRFLFVL